MIESCDTNILFHSLDRGSPFHHKARVYMDSRAADPQFAVCELVLAELYPLLRSPQFSENPLPPAEAAVRIQHLRGNRNWRIIDYPGGLMDQVWKLAGQQQFPRVGVFDARLALTLRHYGVTRFVTRNVKHFQDYGFTEVFDPTA